MPRFEHAGQCFFHLSTCPQMLQHITFKLWKSRFHLNFKCFGVSLLRTLFSDLASLLFRDPFGYAPKITVRSFKLWHTHSKHCFCNFEAWCFNSISIRTSSSFWILNNIIKIFSQQIAPLKYVFRFLWEIPILNIYTRFWCDLRIIVTFNAFDSSHVNHNTFWIP